MSVFQSIKGKFLTFVLCISLIPFIIVTTLYYLHARNILKYKTLEELRTIAEAKRLNVVSLMEKLKIRTVDFSSDGFIRNTCETIIRIEDSQQDGEIKRLNRYLLKHKIPIYQHLKAIIITDTYGKVISSTQENLVGDTISHDGIYLKVAGKDFGEVYVSQPRYYPYLNANCISVSASVISIHDAHSLGVIINVYSLSALNEITADRTGMGKTGEVYLINKDKIMLTESRFIDNAPLKQVVDTEPVRRIIEDGKEVVGVYKDYRGRFVVGALMSIPDYDWILFSEIDKAEIFGPLRGLGSIALILGISSFCVITSMGIIFVVSIVKPINKLIYVTKRFARGDLDYRVEVIGKDEVGELANSFNIMAEGLAREIAGHKSAEEALKESEQKFRAIFDNATDGILLADIETRQFFLGNKAICHILGYSHDEIRDLKVIDIHPGKDLPSVIEKFEKQIKGEIVLAEDIPVKRKDGSVFYADISSANIILGGKAYLIGIFRDITERKRIEDELKEFNKILEQHVAERTSALKKVNEELQREITEHKRAEEMLQKSNASLANAQRIAHLGNFEWDVVKNKVFGSDEFYRICGLTPQTLQEFAGTYESFINFVHPDDKEFVEKTVYEALHEKKPFNIDFRIILESDTERIVHVQAEVIFDTTGKAIQINGTAQDITELKRLEEELRKISNAVEQSASLIVITDNKGNIEYVNPKFTQMTGYALKEVMGKNPRILKSGKTLPGEYKRLWTTITSGGEWRGEFMNKGKNGELYCELASISPVKNSKGIITHFVAVKEDITERKRMEEELRILNRSLEQRVAERTAGLKKACHKLHLEVLERKQAESSLRKSEARLANAQRIAHLGNWEWNIVKNELWWSDEIYRIFGLIPQTFGVTYEAFLDSVHPDDRELVKRSVNEALYQKKPYRIDHRIILPGGSMRIVHEEAEVIFDDTGRAIQMNGTVHDITERKQAEETLRMSEHKYRLLLENLPQRIFYKDKNSIYMSCNENLARDLRIKPDEITGKTDYDFYPKELAEKYRASDKRVIESGQTKDREEEYIKDGQEMIIHIVKTPIRDEKGTIIGVLGIFWDVTEKVALQMEAIRNRHLVALGVLATGVGHEINNPMTGIINCAQILFNKSKEGSKERDIAHRIIKEGDRVVNIVHSLLSLDSSGDGKEEKSIVRIQEVLSDTLILIEAQLRKEGIKVKSDISPNLSRISAYLRQIQQVFLNIISNARYALNEKYPEAHDDKILEILGEEILIDNHPYVKITFCDHGTGIPANIIHKVLDPFFTTKPRHKATGLGLSISHSIIRDHGGKILIESIEGEFTKVIVVLPGIQK
ncbi:MAG: PAS domain-containing sensor histidine kinase [Candidatus Jettenia sp.]|nr:PAS domain S-box protein [Candidatus Jettenia sp. AMX1]MBC6928933.1 PAS domain-containing sensor histidine kinase [Candidatus Jettenia sp.]GIL19644.1 MAG: hypothetical protein BroJett041_07580 [Candidatus Jettenia caeni]KAA0250826.1 MAG: PAS domain S-box protein [Candidatus Jettenia sp. AMX1]MCE7879934.1 PAS domain-containing sensor histidine kinase [Candidatus Jettenia sp. AMX1]MCQ3926714.1 PAS domain-containing sensor histidine kinase [Candidatus Jettenia sp.]